MTRRTRRSPPSGRRVCFLRSRIGDPPDADEGKTTRRTWQGGGVDLDAGIGLFHRLTSLVPDRDWDVPVDDPRVRHDLIPNDPASFPQAL